MNWNIVLTYQFDERPWIYFEFEVPAESLYDPFMDFGVLDEVEDFEDFKCIDYEKLTELVEEFDENLKEYFYDQAYEEWQSQEDYYRNPEKFLGL